MHHRDLPVRHRLNGSYDLMDRVSASRANIQASTGTSPQQMRERAYVYLRKVPDVDVVSHGCAVTRRIIRPEYFDRWPAAESRIDEQGNQVSLR
jgi:hypothetical protein